MTRRLPVLILLLALLLPGGCMSIKQPPPDKRFYAVEIQRPGPSLANNSGPVLRIRPFRISPMYEDQNLVYRDDEVSFQSDFYNAFLVEPSRMIGSEAAQWISDAGLFQVVLSSASKVLPDYVLEGNIEALYGDYRSPEPPKAILNINLFLINARRPMPEVVLQRRYREAVPLDGSNPEDLVIGWNRALENVMKDFEQAVRETGVALSSH